MDSHRAMMRVRKGRDKYFMLLKGSNNYFFSQIPLSHMGEVDGQEYDEFTRCHDENSNSQSK